MARFINVDLIKGLKKPIKITVINECDNEPIDLSNAEITLIFWKGKTKIVKSGNDFSISGAEAVTLMSREDTENIESGVWRVECRISTPSLEDVVLKGQATFRDSKVLEELNKEEENVTEN